MCTLHVPLAGLLALAACGQHGAPAGQLNAAAALPATFGFAKLGLRVLTSTVNHRQATTSVLYGNTLARPAAGAGTGAAQPGAVLALLTWRQQDDPNWFGARIPGALQSAELLRAGSGPAGHPALAYQRFEGSQLVLRADTLHQHARIAFLLAQTPAVLP